MTAIHQALRANVYPGRKTSLPVLSDYDAIQRAAALIRHNAVSPMAKGTLSLLANVGVLPESQLVQLVGIKDRTLRHYRAEHRFLDTVPTPATLNPFIETLGVRGNKKAGKRLTLYTLGPVGKVLAQRYERHPLTGYLHELEEQVVHDVLCNTVYHAIAMQVGTERIRYRNRLSATLRTAAGSAILEPDALLEIKDRRGKKRAFVVEYHNEDTRRRVRSKLERYETVVREVDWADQWELDEFPTVLVSWTHGIVATGYAAEVEHLARQRPLRCRYLGMPIQMILEGQNPLRWKNFATHTVETIIP